MSVIVLASRSPRRRALLEAAGLALAVRPVDVDEAPRPGESPEPHALRLAQDKAAAALAAAPLAHGERGLLAADTVVALDERVLGKPRDDGDARRMLALLAGRTHQVFTGWAVVGPAGRTQGVTRTDVSFRALDQAEIARYVASGEPRDKAGAYGIQGLGGALVDRLHGSYTNVVGLPLAEVLAALRAVGALADLPAVTPASEHGLSLHGIDAAETTAAETTAAETTAAETTAPAHDREQRTPATRSTP